MTDIGDWVTPTLTVGTYDGSTAAVLVLTLPDGTTANGTGEATVGGGAWTADAVQLSQAGLWVMTWTVTGTGKGTEHHYVSVNPAPTAVAAPTDLLANVTDLIYRMPALTEAQLSRAPALLADASTKIRAYTRQHISLVDDDEMLLRPVGVELRLPQRPVVDVTEVVAVGWGGLPDLTLPVGTWGWDGLDIVNVRPLSSEWWINLPEAWAEGDGPNTFRVTNSHGYDPVPDDVVAVACSMVLRVLTSPSAVEGLTSERIGQYSYQMGQFAGGGTAGSSVRLSEDDKTDLARYRRKATTIQMRL